MKIALVLGAALVAFGIYWLWNPATRPQFLGGAHPIPSPTCVDNDRGKGRDLVPCSVPVEDGVLYRFNTGHCGLEFLVDFDGSFWSPRFPAQGEPPEFFSNEDDGTIEIVGDERAIYRSFDGGDADLVRLEGPIMGGAGCA
ncbi:MAG: hypothetical protein ACRDKT_15775 [Actinomycetota bacterium]